MKIVAGKTILLFGMPRSGTTWIGKTFDSHASTLYRHEPDSQKFLENIPLFTENTSLSSINIENAANFLKSIAKSRDSKVCAKLPYFKKTYINSLENFLLKTAIYTTKIPIKKIQKELLYSPSYNDKNFHLVWKSIESLGRLNLFLAIPSEIKAIHIVRHPCGYISSVLKGEQKQKFTSQSPSSNDFGLFKLMLKTQAAKNFGLTLQYLKSLSPIERLSWKWVIYNDHAYIQCKENNNYKIVYYDQLCIDPENGFRNLFQFSDLPDDLQSSEFLKKSTSSNTDSYYSVYKDPKVSSNKWKSYLSDEQVNRIMNIVNQSKVAASIGII